VARLGAILASFNDVAKRDERERSEMPTVRRPSTSPHLKRLGLDELVEFLEVALELYKRAKLTGEAAITLYRVLAWLRAPLTLCAPLPCEPLIPLAAPAAAPKHGVIQEAISREGEEPLEQRLRSLYGRSRLVSFDPPLASWHQKSLFSVRLPAGNR
jgi:hypothetical protein